VGLAEAVVDVGSEGVERNASFLVLFGTGHLGAAEASGKPDLHALGIALLDRVADGLLHGLPEGTAGEQLAGDVRRDQLRVAVGIPDFLDLYLDLLGNQLLELAADLLDVGALDADDDAGAPEGIEPESSGGNELPAEPETPAGPEIPADLPTQTDPPAEPATPVEPQPLVESATVVGLELIAPPDRIQYRVGESVDLTGCELAVRMSDGSLIPVDMQETDSFVDTASSGVSLLRLETDHGSIEIPLLITDSAEVLILNGGVFIRGNDFDAYDDNPEKQISVGSFELSENETTYELWTSVRQWAAEYSPHEWTWSNKGREGNDGTAGDPCTADYLEPVTYISWQDAAIWCNARSEWEGVTPVYYTDETLSEPLRKPIASGLVCVSPRADGWRLPTEAEWEYAAGMGPLGMEDERTEYPGTDDKTGLPRFAWYPASCKAAGRESTWPVGSLESTGAGFYDMAGNVAEWCQDWYDPAWYSNAGESDSGGPAASPALERVIRGSSYSGTIVDCAAANRSVLKFSGKSGTVGFRSARSVFPE